MRGVVSYIYELPAITSARTLMYITAPGSNVIEVLDSWVTWPSLDTNEQAEITWDKISTLGTPTATTVSGMYHEYGMSGGGALSTVKGNVTASEPTYAGTGNRFAHEGVASLSGWRYAPQPESRFYIEPSGSYGIRNMATITSAVLIVGIVVREIG